MEALKIISQSDGKKREDTYGFFADGAPFIAKMFNKS